MDTYRDLRN